MNNISFNEQNNRNVEGRGLGLYITKMLIHAMGGEIMVESEQGKAQHLPLGCLGREKLTR